MTRVTSPATLAAMKPEPVSAADRVRASEARKIAAGGRRIPGGVMPADAAAALEALQAQGYGGSAAGCIFRAVIEAAERLGELRPRRP